VSEAADFLPDCGLAVQEDADNDRLCKFVQALHPLNETLKQLILYIWQNPDRFNIQDLETSSANFLALPDTERAFLDRFSSDTVVAKALLVCVLALQHHYRKDGVTPYAIHPLRIAYLFSLFTELPEAFARRGVLLALLHDVPEELITMYGLGRTNPWLDDVRTAISANKPHLTEHAQSLGVNETALVLVSVIHTKINEVFRGEQALEIQSLGQDVLLLTQPSIDYGKVSVALGLDGAADVDTYVAESSLLAHQIKLRDTTAIKLVQVFDRLEWFSDLAYLKQRSVTAALSRVAEQLARTLWVLPHITGATSTGEPVPTAYEVTNHILEPMLTFAVLMIRYILEEDDTIQQFMRNACKTVEFITTRATDVLKRFRIAGSHTQVLEEKLDVYYSNLFQGIDGYRDLLAQLP